MYITTKHFTYHFSLIWLWVEVHLVEEEGMEDVNFEEVVVQISLCYIQKLAFAFIEAVANDTIIAKILQKH